MRCLVSLILLWGFLISQSLFAIRPSEPSSGLLSKVVREGFTHRRLTVHSTLYSHMRHVHAKEGFVSSNVHLGHVNSPDSTCQEVSLSSGIAVNHCKHQDDYWYKFHLTHDSCLGGTIEYFDDAACDSFIGVSELDGYEGKCEESVFEHDHSVYQVLQCSTSREPPVPHHSYVTRYFAGSSGCEGPVIAYDAYAAGSCLYMSNKQSMMVVNCTTTGTKASTGPPGLVIYGNSSCSGPPIATNMLLPHCLANQDDDDHFMAPFLHPPSSSRTSTDSGAGVTVGAESMGDGSSSSAVGGAGVDLDLDVTDSWTVSTMGACIAPTPPADDDDATQPMGAGAIVAIVLGTVAGALLVVLLVYNAIFHQPLYTAWWHHHQRSNAPRGRVNRQPQLLDTEMSLSGGLLQSHQYEDIY